VLVAQNSSTSQIRGVVTDSTGAVVPEANVLIRNLDTGTAIQRETNSQGNYYATELQIGHYSITVTKAGFKQYDVTSLDLHLEPVTINAVLQVGVTTEVMTVSAQAEQLETESSDLNTTLTTQSFAELPQVGNTWFDLTGLLPGVNPGNQNQTGGQFGRESSAEGQGIGLNGAGAFQSSWLIDGGLQMSMVSQESGFATPDDAIAEVDVKTGNMSAEYGTGLSAFNVLIKTGTNAFHGTAFEYNENTVFLARQPFNATITPLHWNLFGGTLGGPIKKNKAFFFFSFQRNMDNATNATFLTVPDQNMKNGDFSEFANVLTIYDPATTQCTGSGVSQVCTRQAFQNNQIPAGRIDPVAKAMQTFFAPLNNPANGYSNNSYFTAPANIRQNWYDAKGNYDITKSDRLTLTYQDIKLVQPNPQPYLWTEEPGTQIQKFGQITNAWTVSPSALNETRVSYFNENEFWPVSGLGQGYEAKLGLKNLPIDDMPQLSMSGYTSPGWNGEPYPSSLFYTTVAAADSFTWIRGKHAFKFGGEFDDYYDDNAWAYVNAGNFYFSGAYTNNPDPTAKDYGAPVMGYADFLLGDVNTWNVGYAPEYRGRNKAFQIYAQDDFKLNQKLTVNVGLRWGIQPGWTEKNNEVGSFDPTLMNPATKTLGAMWYGGQNGRTAEERTKYLAFSPRLGFAWSPFANTAVRGGFGIYQNFRGANVYLIGGGIDNGVNNTLKDYTNLTPVFQLQNSNPAITYPTLPPSASALNGQSVPYIPYDTPLTYVGQWQLGIQQRLSSTLQLDVAYVGNRGTHVLSNVNINQVPAATVAAYGIAAENMRPYPQYQNIYASLFEGWSNYHSLQAKVRKTMSHGFDLQSTFTWAKSLDTGTMAGWGGSNVNNGTLNIQDAYNIGKDYGRGMSDLRVLWNGAAIYQLPFGRKRAFLNRGGLTDAVLGGWQVSNIWQVHSGLPFTPTWGGAYVNYSDSSGTIRPNRTCNGALGKAQRLQLGTFFDTRCFSGPANGTFGNSGRDILSGPDFANMDASVTKSWKLSANPVLGEESSLEFKADADNVFNHTEFQNPGATIGSSNAGKIQSAFPSRIMEMGLKLKF
jgi:hypothetical protein